jgi:hypothetical protein
MPQFFHGGGEGADLVSRHGLGWVSEPGDYEALQAQLQQFALLTDSQLLALKENVHRQAQTTFSKDLQDQAFLAFVASFFPA